MGRGRVMNNRQQAKRSSTVALVLSMLLMLTVVLLMLLALGILSLPVSSVDDSSSSISNQFKFGRKIIKHNNLYAAVINLCTLTLHLFIHYVLTINVCGDLLWLIAMCRKTKSGKTSGPKFFRGSLGLSYIIISWFVFSFSFFLLDFLCWYSL